MTNTIETLDGLEVSLNRVVGYSVVQLSLYDSCVAVKLTILTDTLGEAVQKTLRRGFDSMDEARKFMDSILNLSEKSAAGSEATDGGSGELFVVWG
jgi:hypothetical protein